MQWKIGSVRTKRNSEIEIYPHKICIVNIQFSVGDSKYGTYDNKLLLLPQFPLAHNSTNFALQALVFLLEIHLNSPKCLLYWNFISDSDFKHITAINPLTPIP